jgi:hypothetical protein
VAIVAEDDEAWIREAAAKEAWIRLGFSHNYVCSNIEGMLEYAKEAKAAAREECTVCTTMIAAKQTADEVCVQRWPECDHGRLLCAPCHLTVICTAMTENHVLLQDGKTFQFVQTDPHCGNDDQYECSSCRAVVVDREGFNAHARGQEFKDLMDCDRGCRAVMLKYARESAAAAVAQAGHMVPIDVDEEF